MIAAGRVNNIKMAGIDKPDRTFKTSLLFWHPGRVTRAAQRKIAELLANPVKSRIFESLPAPALTQSTLDHVCWVRRYKRLQPFFLFVPDLQPYNVEEYYERGKAESDVTFCPHAAFRSLNTGHDWEAVDFVNEFGPLELRDELEPRRPLRSEDLFDFGEVIPGEEEPPAPKERSVWVDVDDFWNKQKRFVAVAKLWESRESPQAMRSALFELATLPVYPSIGARWDGQEFYWSAFPWENGKFGQWARGANMERLMAASVEIIQRELDLQAHEMRIRWTCSKSSRQEFRIVPTAPALWPAIWQLFARDISEGLAWRVCPHCAKLFYPKRKDSYFCQSKYQKRHSANRWWNEHSKDELDKRRKERAKTRLTRKKTAHNPRAKGRK